MTVPQMMMAIGISQPGAPSVLKPVRAQVPTPGPEEVLVRVMAAGINRPDLLQRRGAYPPPAGVTDIPGLEVAGEIVQVGQDVSGDSTLAGKNAARGAGVIWEVGDRVCALVAGGGYAEYVAVPAVQCLPIPAGVSVQEAAAIPETFFTVYYNLFMRAGLKAKETVLIHGGSGGIGTTAIMLARAFDANVIVTTGSQEKCDACLALGAHYAINYRTEDFVVATRVLTNGKGPDVILDMVGGDYVAKNVTLAAVDGRISVIATQGGYKADIDLRTFMTKRLLMTASTLRPQPVANKGRIAAELQAHVWPLFGRADGPDLKPRIHARFTLAEAWRAHELMESGQHIGKIILIA